ncbi:MAG: hypothetical protein Kow00109_07460 [Acidobacteriota bacterium]
MKGTIRRIAIVAFMLAGVVATTDWVAAQRPKQAGHTGPEGPAVQWQRQMQQRGSSGRLVRQRVQRRDGTCSVTADGERSRQSAAGRSRGRAGRNHGSGQPRSK